MRRLGGSSANEQLTAVVAVVLVPLLLAEGATLLNVRSLLTVHARELSTGKEATLKIAPSGGLGPEEMARLLEARRQPPPR